MKYFNIDEIFEHSYARIKPFILSKGRSIISKISEPFLNKIVRCHTDGFYSMEKLPIKIGHSIGDIKYKYHINIDVINVDSISK